MLTDQQKRTCQNIVQIFETGRVNSGSYGTVTLLRGDTGRLTYGKHQTTIASGGLYFLVKAYTEARGKHSEKLKPYLPLLKEKRIVCDTDKSLHSLLKQAGDDLVMQEIQEKFFDRVYWDTAVEQVAKLGFSRPLTYAVVYDSIIHGSWNMIANRTRDKVLYLKNVSERLWIEAYVKQRDSWLRTHSNKLLRKTVYRMNEFSKLIADNQWELALPLTVRGVRLLPDAKMAIETIEIDRASADEGTTRLLYLKNPNISGIDVRQLQEALVKRRFLDSSSVDSVFGPATDRAVKAYQKASNLTTDGIVGSRTMAKLSL